MRICMSLHITACFFLLAGCGNDGTADDGTGDPDAAIVAPAPPDAHEAPDAAPVDDADPGAPDAAPGDPDAAPVPDAAPAPDALPAVSYNLDVVPILMARCGGCHLKAAGGAGMLSFGTQAELAYEAMVDKDTVNIDPDCADLMRIDSMDHNPERSSVYLKITGTTCGNRMPSGMNPVPLNTPQTETIRRWIEAGAPNN